ncbi:MAG: hypothetical protein JXB50_15750 [Spirochaetes bacterium]|nr:hypothetical protein [Spirochaetota bacterium]
MKKSLILIIFIFCSFLIFSQSSDEIKIMCLGDSITDGANLDYIYAYRYYLWKKFLTLGIRVRFVGTRSGITGIEPPATDPDENLYPGWNASGNCYHEGRGGWTTFDVLYGNDYYHQLDINALPGPDNINDNRLETWLFELRKNDDLPDVVFIHLGTNDVQVLSIDISQTFNNLLFIIQKIKQYNPDIKIIISKIIPMKQRNVTDQSLMFPAELYPMFDFRTNYLNNFIANLNNPLENIITVDNFNGFDIYKDSLDGLHPNMCGAEKIAHKFYISLLKFFPYIAPADFDPDFYFEANQDLIYRKLNNLWPCDESQVVDHYIEHGIREGRQASPVFSVTQYFWLNEDLQQVFGLNTEQLTYHYTSFGIHEYRRSSFAFDPFYYLQKYPEIYLDPRYSGPSGAARHWAEVGLANSYEASPVFNPDYYLEHNSDVAAACGYNPDGTFEEKKSARIKALIHYNTFGVWEGREASENFNVYIYYDLNTDLHPFFDINKSIDRFKLIMHYLRYGRDEGRRAH